MCCHATTRLERENLTVALRNPRSETVCGVHYTTHITFQKPPPRTGFADKISKSAKYPALKCEVTDCTPQVLHVPGGIASVPKTPGIPGARDNKAWPLCVSISKLREKAAARTHARRPPFPGSPSGERGPQASQEELTSLAFKYKAIK